MSLKRFPVLGGSAVLLCAVAVRGGDLYREWRAELADRGYEGRADLLSLLRSSEEKTLRLKAAHALSFEGQASDGELIEEILWREPWTDGEKVSLARAITNLNRGRGEKVSLKLLREFEKRRSRLEAMSLLAALGRAPRYGELIAVLEEGSPEERANAVRVVGYLVRTSSREDLEPDPLQVLVGLTEHGDEELRRTAVRELGLALQSVQVVEDEQTMIERALCKRWAEESNDRVRRALARRLTVHRWTEDGMEPVTVDCEEVLKNLEGISPPVVQEGRRPFRGAGSRP